MQQKYIYYKFVLLLNKMVVVDTGRRAQLTMSSSFRHVESLSFPNLNTRTLSSVVFMALSTSFLLPRLFNIAAILSTWSPATPTTPAHTQ